MNLWACKWTDRVMVEQFNLIGEHCPEFEGLGSTKKNTSLLVLSLLL